MRVLAGLALALLWLAPLGSAPAAEADRLAGAIAALGYAVKSDRASGPTSWESAQFDLQRKRALAIKARRPLPTDSRTFYRFTVIEERYADPAAAQARLARIFEKPPGLGPEDDLVFPLRDGFRRGETVYIVATDVSLFYYKELSKVTARLEAALAH